MTSPEASATKARDGVVLSALWIAAGVATAFPVVLVILGFSLAFDSLIPRPQDAPVLIGCVVAAVFVAFLSVISLALPLHWLLGRIGVLGTARVMTSSTIAGLPASCLWLLLQMLSNDPLSQLLVQLWPVTVLLPGLIGGIVYCFVAPRLKPAEGSSAKEETRD